MRGTLLIALLVAGLSAPPAAASSRIVDEPVAFRVQNTNTSQVPCQSDGASYVVRGHLTGPRSARTVTLYYEGFESGEWNWRFRRVPGYDYAADMAERGHASVTIDQVGYGASGHPEGWLTCFGAQADIAHQIIGQLRDRGFEKVVLAGHDIGGGIAEIEAYSYHDVDGLMVFTWQEQDQTPYLLQTFADANARCAAAGEPAYVYFPHLEDWPLLLPNSEPAVVAGAAGAGRPNPCGRDSCGPGALFFNGAPSQTGRGLSTIDVPVLLVLGALD